MNHHATILQIVLLGGGLCIAIAYAVKCCRDTFEIRGKCAEFDGMEESTTMHTGTYLAEKER